MAAPIDSATIVSTGNQVVQIINIVWPIVASVLAYILGHRWTTRKKALTIPKV